MWQLIGAGNCGTGRGKMDLEFSNNDFRLTRAIFHSNKFKYYVLYVKIHIKLSRIWLYIF